MNNYREQWARLRQQVQLINWLAIRFLLSKSKSIFQGTAWISFSGLILGVACLVVSMAVMSGFESTLKKSVADVTGHLRLRKSAIEKVDWGSVFDKIKELEPDAEASLQYAYMEGVLAGSGMLTGVLLQGVQENQVLKVLNLDSRMIAGEFKLTSEAEPKVLIGKGLASQFRLKPGDTFRVVFPLSTEIDPTQFRRKIATFRVSGILDLGKKEFDDRMVISSLATAQKLAENDRSSGLLVRLKDIDKAREIGFRLSRELGPAYQISDWREINENLFEAVQIERVVVFFVILVIIIAAAFNVSSTLFINVLKRYPDIGVLKTLGFSQKKIIQLFSLQGLMMGFLGVFLGMILGWILCGVFSWAEVHYSLIPTSVYKLDRIDLNVRPIDLLAISVSTLVICLIATLAPALRGARLSVVEGIRHE